MVPVFVILLVGLSSCTGDDSTSPLPVDAGGDATAKDASADGSAHDGAVTDAAHDSPADSAPEAEAAGPDDGATDH
jgi:hypothetical protein